MEESTSLLRRSTRLMLAAAILLVPGRAAEPDPKAVSYTLPDKIEWRKGDGFRHGHRSRRPFETRHLHSAPQVASATI